jgi:large subunit ribosomal protein L25
VAGERVKLEVSERTSLGSSESRRLRKQGVVPGVLYGRTKPVAIAVGERELRAALTTSAGSHVVLDVSIGNGREHSVILKDYQRDKVRGTITHIDLQEVRLDQPIQTAVVVTLVGEAAGTKEGGVLSQVVNEINVEALPLEVPQHIEVDVSALHIGDSLRLADIEALAGVTFLDDPEETVLATITPPTLEPVEDEIETETALVGEDGEPLTGEELEAAQAEAEGDTGDEAGSDSDEES